MGCIQTKQSQEKQSQEIKSNNKLALALDFDIDLHYNNDKKNSYCDSDESFHL
jgi:hypothetical protein